MDKIRVNVLTTYSKPNSHALIYPLLTNRSFFNKEGIDIRFFGAISDEVYNCDVIFINSKFFREWHKEKKVSRLYDTLIGFKNKIQKVIWFDTTDSTGTTQFNIMPFVDGYYKSQVLKERSLYYKTFYGYRIFTDFCKRVFAIDDGGTIINQGIALPTPLQKKYEGKLHVSWNSAMDDWGLYNFFSERGRYRLGGLIAKIRASLPFEVSYAARFINVDKDRKRDISARIGSSHSRDTVKGHRQIIINILRKFDAKTSSMPRRQYLNEIKNSKISVSPFGWGEICYRDFESIISGALLFKGDMSHLETWPPLYVKDETYIPYSWDLKDFEEKLRNILNNGEKIRAISKRAQEIYAYYLHGDGRLEFCNKVLDIIR